VDDVALAAAVESGRIEAAVDVLENEPSGGEARFDHPLVKLPGVCATPHIGASTDQAQSAIADEVVRIVGGYLRGGTVANAVNVNITQGARTTVILRHLDRVGVLAAVLQELRAEDLNVQEMSNVIFAGNEAASATITVAAPPSDGLLQRIRARPDVLDVSLRHSEA
ncbi:MAG: NAD(P)-dependent oxidoreductase, partial [Myxococcota bacterium]